LRNRPAVHELSTAAKVAIAAEAAEKTHAHALTDLPPMHAGPERINPSDDLMARSAGPGHRKQALESSGIGVAHTAGLDA
jgi:hypothetical protein